MFKKMILLLLPLMLMTACSDKKETVQNVNKKEISSSDKEVTKEEQLVFLVPKAAKDEGKTIENDQLLSQLNQQYLKNKDIGGEGTYSLYYSGLAGDDETGSKAMFFFINRTNKSMEDISFNFSYGIKDGEMVWSKMPITLKASEFGQIEKNTITPVAIPIPENKVNLFKTIDAKNGIVQIQDFNFNEVQIEK